MAEVVALVQAGKELGYNEEELKAFVKQHQEEAREQRALERDKIKQTEEFKALEIEKLRVHEGLEKEKLRLEKEKLEIDRIRAESETSTFGKGKTKLPSFNEDKDKFDAYISRFESYANMRKWKKEEWSLQLSLLLTGKTLDTFYGLSDTEQKDYEIVKEALMRKFSLTEEDFRKQLFSTKVETGETPPQFMTRLERLFQKWVGAAKIEKSFNGLWSLVLREEFYKRCSADLAAYLREKGKTDVVEIANTAQRYLDAHGGTLAEVTQVKREGIAVSMQGRSEGNTNANGKASCSLCKKQGHTVQTCFFKNQSDGVRKCFRCGDTNLIIKQCSKQKEGVGSAVMIKPLQEQIKGVTPRRGLMERYKDLAAEEISELLNVPISEGKVNGQNVMVMRDSGFGLAAVRASLVKQDQYLDKYDDFLLMDCTPRTFQRAQIFVESQYYTGELEVLVVDNPVVDLVFGNVNGVGKENDEDSNMIVKKTNTGHEEGIVETVLVEE